ncbi:HK97 family phage portal protein [Bradyrhizobium diazoefficiens]
MKWWTFRKKALPAPGSTAFFVTGLTSAVTRTIKQYAGEGYEQNPIVYACISRIAEACSSVKLEVHKLDSQGNKTVLNNHKVLDLLKRPNPTQTWVDFIIELIAWHRVAGEVFILRLPEKGPAAELYCLDPSMIQVERDANGSAVPTAYVYGTGPNKRTFPVNIATGESQVLHIKTFNPSDPFRGLPPMKPAARAIDTHNHGAQWNSNLLLNGARPSGIVEFASTVADSVLSQMREFFKKAWQGVVNAGNIPILTGGAKFTPLSHTPKDMDFEKSMGEAAKNVALVFGVPLPLVTMEASTFSNMDAAYERLWIDTVMPLLGSILGALTNFLMPLYGSGSSSVEILAYNADSVPALEPRRTRLFTRMQAAVVGSLITPNEARAEMGFEDVKTDGANSLLVAGTMKTLDHINDKPPAPVAAPAKAPA